MAKGIRVNQLAKELNVSSKEILDKCKAEGLSDKVPNHMTVVSVGLSETVREWFSSGSLGGGTAVETAAKVETKTKASKTAKKKKADEHGPADDAGSGDESAEIPEPTTTTLAPEAPVVQEAPAAVAPIAPVMKEVTHAAPAPTPVVPAPAPEATVAPVAPVVPPAAPAVAATVTAPKPPASHAGPEHGVQRVISRPTVTLANRPNQTMPERKPVTVAPQLTVLKPAVIQGPRVVREEKPDFLPPPRPRPRPGGPGGPTSEPPAFLQARPQAGRGVKVDDDDEEAKKKAAAKGRSLSSRRRGPDGRRGEAMEKLKEYTEADLIERRDRLAAAASYRTGFDLHIKKTSERGTHQQAKTAAETGSAIEIEEPITVKSLSATIGVKSNDIIARLMKQGVFASVNQGLATETAIAIAMEYGVELRIMQEQTLEEELTAEFENREVNEASLAVCPPVVTILGHVDHGKTSLLDRIRSTNVAAGEAGGITQHTAAWMVEVGEGEARKRVTFIDTPGHQAFTSMRARGANMTDVVVLVVSAAEGVQPQTIESINHAKAAGVPIVVALNKIDRADANPDMVLGQLAKEGLNPVEWGGTTEVIRTSATTGQGIPELIEILDYQSQLLALRADPTAPAMGTVIEARMDEGLGAIATVLVQEGTLHRGDVVLCGSGYGRVRAILNDRGELIEEAGPSMPVIVSGLDELPLAGDKFFVVEDAERAREIAEERKELSRHSQLAGKNQVTLDNIFATMKAGEMKTINLIIKADVAGSVETLVKTVAEQGTSEVRIRVIHSGVGGITESDIELADASDAVVIGFHVVPDETARAMAEQRRVEIRLYRVIYEIFDDLKKALSGMLEPEVREKLHGHADIRRVFNYSKVGNIAGCIVSDGHIQRGSKIRLIRNSVVITEDLSIESLKRLKEDAKEVKAGLECGIKLAGYDDIKAGDRLEAYIRETIQRIL